MKPQARSRGFTLIELLIVLVAVAILATIAVPAYQDSLRKTRRTEAKTTLDELAQRLERCMTQFGRYDDANCTIGSAQDSASGYYRITVTRSAAGFSLTAAAQNVQADDRACASFSLNQLGARSASRSDGSVNAACW